MGECQMLSKNVNQMKWNEMEWNELKREERTLRVNLQNEENAAHIVQR